MDSVTFITLGISSRRLFHQLTPFQTRRVLRQEGKRNPQFFRARELSWGLTLGSSQINVWPRFPFQENRFGQPSSGTRASQRFYLSRKVENGPLLDKT